MTITAFSFGGSCLSSVPFSGNPTPQRLWGQAGLCLAAWDSLFVLSSLATKPVLG